MRTGYLGQYPAFVPSLVCTSPSQTADRSRTSQALIQDHISLQPGELSMPAMQETFGLVLIQNCPFPYVDFSPKLAYNTDSHCFKNTSQTH